MLIKNGIPKIEAVFAAEILDSRGDPSVRAFLRLTDGSVGCGDAPSGASTGKYEAVERRDGGGDGRRYGGRGVLDACAARSRPRSYAQTRAASAPSTSCCASLTEHRQNTGSARTQFCPYRSRMRARVPRRGGASFTKASAAAFPAGDFRSR